MYINSRHIGRCGCNNFYDNCISNVIEDVCDDAKKEANCGCKIKEEKNICCQEMNSCSLKEKIYETMETNINSCSCGFKSEKIDNGLPEFPELANAYVPIQKINQTFCPEVGLKMGTIFPELVRPYMPNQSIAMKEFLDATNEVKGGCNCGM